MSWEPMDWREESPFVSPPGKQNIPNEYFQRKFTENINQATQQINLK